MSYFKNVKIEDENNNVVDSYDVRNLGLKQLLFLMYVELKKMNIHLQSMTDEKVNNIDLE